jgi:hypothetical protein
MEMPSAKEGQDLVPDETWSPRGQGLERTIVDLATDVDGQEVVTYRTRHGEFVTSARNFRFWIDRLSASPSCEAVDHHEYRL